MRQPMSRLAFVASAAVILAVGLAPLGVQAADHLDSLTVSSMGAADLTDVYAFAVSGHRSVLIANVNPAAGALPNSTIYFGSGVQYNVTVDTNGDASPDVTYALRFKAPVAGQQAVSIWRNGALWGDGTPATRSTFRAARSFGPASLTIRSSSTSTRSRATSLEPPPAACSATAAPWTSSRASTSARSC